MTTVKFFTVNLMGDFDMRDVDWDSKKFKALIKTGTIKGYCHVPLGKRQVRLNATDQLKAYETFGKWIDGQLAAEVYDDPLSVIPVPNKIALAGKKVTYPTLALANAVAGQISKAVPVDGARWTKVLPSSRDDASLRGDAGRATLRKHLKIAPPPKKKVPCIVVDDVWTSGASIGAVCDELQKAGWSVLMGFCSAFTIHERLTDPFKVPDQRI